MANPTSKANSETMDFSGLEVDCAQLSVDGTPVLASQGSNIADLSTSLTITWTANDPGGTPNGAITIANGNSISNAEIGEFLEEVEAGFSEITTKVNAIITALEDAGILADS